MGSGGKLSRNTHTDAKNTVFTKTQFCQSVCVWERFLSASSGMQCCEKETVKLAYVYGNTGRPGFWRMNYIVCLCVGMLLGIHFQACFVVQNELYSCAVCWECFWSLRVGRPSGEK